MAGGISDSRIDTLYQYAIENGALGGKLLGAGGGGFLLFYCPKERQERLTNRLRLKPYEFKFEHDGSSIVYIGDKYWETM